MITIITIIGEILNHIQKQRKEIRKFTYDLEQIKDDIITRIDDLPNEMRKLLRNEMNGLLYNNISMNNNGDVGNMKNSKFQSFIDEINDKNLLMAIESSLLKDDGALDTFFCPITKQVMEDPVICIASGNTYEAMAIRKHISNCFERGE